jgi:hypothetical protein
MKLSLSTMIGALTTLVAASLCTVAQAQFFNNNTGLASPTSTITFDEFGIATNTVLTTQYQSLGITFSPNAYQTNQGGYPNTDSFDIGNSPGGPAVNPVTINFTTPLTSAAFALATDVGVYTFTASLGGVPVDVAVFNTLGYTIQTDFYGFSGITFDAISIDGSAATGGPYFDLDNLQLGSAATPEPGTYALLGSLTLTGAALLRRRRTR